MRDSLRKGLIFTGIFFLFGLKCLTSVAVAQNQQTTIGQSGIQESLRTVSAVRVDHSPRLDGTLNDPLWEKASLQPRRPKFASCTTSMTSISASPAWIPIQKELLRASYVVMLARNWMTTSKSSSILHLIV